MIYINKILTLSDYDLEHILIYDKNKEEMIKDVLSSFEIRDIIKEGIKKIIINENCFFKDIKTEYSSFEELINTLHPYGDSVYLYPYYGISLLKEEN